MEAPLYSASALAVGFEVSSFSMDLSGWESEAPVFQRLIDRIRPKLIIEVGSWKGASGMHLAGCCWKLSLQTEIICVDTWLGSLEMWNKLGDPTRYGSLNRQYGYPNVYYQFLANVVMSGHADRIWPFPQTSLIASRALAALKVAAD